MSDSTVRLRESGQKIFNLKKSQEGQIIGQRLWRALPLIPLVK